MGLIRNIPNRGRHLTYERAGNPAEGRIEMTTLLLNTFLVLITILFAAMALYPLFLGGPDTDLQAEPFGDDRVISVVPVGLDSRRPTSIGPAPAGESRDEHPGHQPAA
jgi:hypothetical protein